MALPDDVRALFPGQKFGAPCTNSDIRRAELELGESLPVVLCELYLAFDGFLGPTDATFFWPLFGSEGLVKLNQFFRRDELFPQELVTRCVFFGDDGCGASWGIKRDSPGSVIQWDAEWGADFEVVGSSPLEAWLTCKQMYAASDGDS